MNNKNNTNLKNFENEEHNMSLPLKVLEAVVAEHGAHGTPDQVHAAIARKRNLAYQLETFAKSDLKSARQERHILIGRTQRGTVALTYSRTSNTYTITTQGVDPKVLATGKASEIRKVLVNLYTVQTLRSLDES